jgi:hypothetical protein
VDSVVAVVVDSVVAVVVDTVVAVAVEFVVAVVVEPVVAVVVESVVAVVVETVVAVVVETVVAVVVESVVAVVVDTVVAVVVDAVVAVVVDAVVAVVVDFVVAVVVESVVAVVVESVVAVVVESVVAVVVTVEVTVAEHTYDDSDIFVYISGVYPVKYWIATGPVIPGTGNTNLCAVGKSNGASGLPNSALARRRLSVTKVLSLVTWNKLTPTTSWAIGVVTSTSKTPFPTSAACHIPPLNGVTEVIFTAAPVRSVLPANSLAMDVVLLGASRTKKIFVFGLDAGTFRASPFSNSCTRSASVQLGVVT